MKNTFTAKISIFLLAMALAPSLSRAEGSVRALTERFLELANSRDNELRLRGFERGNPGRGCELSVIQSDRVGLYEVRLSATDLGRTFPITSAERWSVEIGAGNDENSLTAVGSAKFQQMIPGLGIPLGTKYVRHELSASRAEPNLIRVSLKHSVSGFAFDDGIYTLACDFPLN